MHLFTNPTCHKIVVFAAIALGLGIGDWTEWQKHRQAPPHSLFRGDGRIEASEINVAAPSGELLGVDAKVLRQEGQSELHMSFVLPERVARRVAPGSEVRIVLDTARDLVIPARVSHIANAAQPAPAASNGAASTAMFRVSAQIDRAVVQDNAERLRTGLAGVAWLKLDEQAEWPTELALKDHEQ